MSADSITCPRCGRTSWNSNDVREGYCGFCHAFTRGEPPAEIPSCGSCDRPMRLDSVFRLAHEEGESPAMARKVDETLALMSAQRITIDPDELWLLWRCYDCDTALAIVKPA